MGSGRGVSSIRIVGDDPFDTGMWALDYRVDEERIARNLGRMLYLLEVTTYKEAVSFAKRIEDNAARLVRIKHERLMRELARKEYEYKRQRSFTFDKHSKYKPSTSVSSYARRKR